jgi:hypothetical protein
MEELKAQFKLVLILVPTQAKVMELQMNILEKSL